MARSSWAILWLFLTTSTALNVKFQEADITVKEDAGFLQAVVTMDYRTNANVTIQVVPRTLQQYRASGRQLPQDVHLAMADPAEEELDFDGSPHTILLECGARQVKVVNITIKKDNLTEREEVFLLELRIVRVDPPEERNTVYSGRNVTIVRIKPSKLDFTRIRLVAEKLHFDENDGTIPDALFIELDREIEPNVTLRISQATNGLFQGLRDIEIPEKILIPSRTLRINIPFTIIDDNITERNETVSISLIKKTHHLYDVDPTMVQITIKDNDAPRIGFTWNGTATGSLQIVEGEALEFCVALLEPQASEQFFQLTLSTSPSHTSTGVSLDRITSNFYLLPQTSRKCFFIRAPDNDIIDEVKNTKFQIKMDENKGVILNPASLSIDLMDNDGAPMKPDRINLSQTDSNLYISWTANANKFKPVEKFMVLITKIDPTTSVISRRQTHDLYEEHETNKTFYAMSINTKSLYIIQICASNKNIRNCSKELIFSRDSETIENYFASTEESSNSPPLEDPIPLGLENGKNIIRTEGLGKTGIIAVIVGPTVAFALSILLILTVFFCKCWGERKHYYPSHQEKIVMASSVEMKSYYRQRSSTSSMSTDWTLTSPNNYFMPSPKEAKPNDVTLGTPV